MRTDRRGINTDTCFDFTPSFSGRFHSITMSLPSESAIIGSRNALWVSQCGGIPGVFKEISLFMLCYVMLPTLYSIVFIYLVPDDIY